MINFNTNFPSVIENIVYMKDVNYIEAVVEWVNANNYEIEYAADLIQQHPTIKAKIELEAQDLGIIKKTARLPI
jgi:hypothetical protein